ncbi:DUF4422 domain-containing protein [Candidatus Saccharibacteria bacterium]|nr:DUF4422 domain-containing protein [Candidatus Saccharibacteria bacterium]
MKSDIFMPIQVGAALSEHKISGFLKDDTGDHISEKNARYCELTAQYWTWKNYAIDANYVGFFHYRRYLAFHNKNNLREDVWGNIQYPAIDSNFIEVFGLQDDNIEQYINGVDIILPRSKNIRHMPGMGKTNREQYSSSGYLRQKDLDILMNVIDEKYPDFTVFAKKYFASHRSYFNNMFIMRRDIFDKYAKWLFDILEECDKRIDYSGYSVEAMRTIGHLAERLLNIYILYLRDKHQYIIKELPTVYIHETRPRQMPIRQAFKEKNIAIVLSANNHYVPYLSTAIASIVQNSDRQNNYDILVFQTDISQDNQERIVQVFKKQQNIKIRFIDVSSFADAFDSLSTHGHFSIETWYRLVMPDILTEYKKVLYLDSDLVVEHDVSDLYNTDVSRYLVAATRDADTAGLYNGYDPDRKNYMDSILKIRKPYDYFQAGVVLFNLEYFRKKINTNELLSLAASYDWKLLDQDVLNNIAQEKVLFIDMSWNVLVDWRKIRAEEIINRAPRDLNNEYLSARQSPKIIHYAGDEKPWENLSMDFASCFWYYAKYSGYYEELLCRAANPKKQRWSDVIKREVKKMLPVGTRRGELVRRIIARRR